MGAYLSVRCEIECQISIHVLFIRLRTGLEEHNYCVAYIARNENHGGYLIMQGASD